MSEPVGRARSQGFWLAGGQVTIRAVQLLSTVALARILLPEHFGKVAIAAVAWEVVALFGNTGIAATLVHRRDKVPELCQAAFWLNACVSVSVAAGSLLVAVLASRFYKEPVLLPIMGLYASSFVISSLGVVNSVLLTREVAFGRLALVDTCGAVASSACAVLLALAGFGLWSLVLHAPLVSALRVAALWRLHPWRPKMGLRTDLWKEIFGYGRYVLGSDLATYVSLNGDYIVTGKVLGAQLLGVYSMAYRLANYPVEAGVWLVARIAFPTLSSLQEDPERLREVFVKMLKLVGLLATPAIAMLFVAAPDLVAALYGRERWGGASPLIRILMPYVLFRAIGSPANQVLLATGRARTSFRLGVSVTPVLMAGVLWGSRFGIVGVAGATSAVLGIAAITVTVVSCRAAGAPLPEVARALRPGAALGLTALVASWAGAAGVSRLLVLSGMGGSPLGASTARLGGALAAGTLASWALLYALFQEERGLLMRNLGEVSMPDRFRRLGRGFASALAIRSK